MALAEEKPQSSASPWRRALIVYLVLAAAVFAFPGGMVSWLDDRNASGLLDAPLAVARGIEAASSAIGVKWLGSKLRHAFAGWVGADES